ncbi:chaperonin 10-like protein [Mycena leptocephala]|nr:chaperonin 10-like protein [Mycena leptocephala]
MSTQQALIIPSPKAPFKLGQRQVPVPGKGEVRLKIMAVGLNPMNWAQHEFDFLIFEYPAVIGADIAGVVDEVGEGVDGFSKGDEVFVQALSGGFQQYCILPAVILIHKPKNVSFDEVATFPITFTTAAVGLFAQAPIGLGLNPSYSWDKPQQGESGLVIGGGTSTGQFAVQLMKFLGFTRIVVYASKVHFEYLKELGATEYIDRGEVPIEALVVSPPVTVVYDATHTGALDAAYDSVVDGGKVTTATTRTSLFSRSTRPLESSSSRATKDAGEGCDRGTGFFFCFTLRHGLHTFQPNRIEVLPKGLAGIPEALERMKAGGVSGVKLVAHPQESTT